MRQLNQATSASEIGIPLIFALVAAAILVRAACADPNTCFGAAPCKAAQRQQRIRLPELAKLKQEMAQLAETLTRLDRAARDQGS